MLHVSFRIQLTPYRWLRNISYGYLDSSPPDRRLWFILTYKLCILIIDSECVRVYIDRVNQLLGDMEVGKWMK